MPGNCRLVDHPHPHLGLPDRSQLLPTFPSRSDRSHPGSVGWRSLEAVPRSMPEGPPSGWPV